MQQMLTSSYNRLKRHEIAVSSLSLMQQQAKTAHLAVGKRPRQLRLCKKAERGRSNALTVQNMRLQSREQPGY